MEINTVDQPQKSRRQITLIGISSIVISTAVVSLIWTRQSFFALLGVFLLVTGGYTILPWKTPAGKAVSIGIFIGIVLATGMFYLNILGRPQ
jgi:hypothetical protein